MKEKLKDRIDVLFEKAHAGDSEAQLKLAKSFYKGRFVEKSMDQAKYWAFKSMSSGNSSANSLYQQLCYGAKEDKYAMVANLGSVTLFLPMLEFLLGLIGVIFAPKNSLAEDICTWIFAVGIASFLLGFIPMGKLSETKYEKYAIPIGIIGVIIVHIIAVYIIL